MLPGRARLPPFRSPRCPRPCVRRCARCRRDVECDHRFVLDHQHANSGDPLQLAARLLQACARPRSMSMPRMWRGITHGEILEDGQQQHLALQRRHLGQRFLQPAADAAFAAAFPQAAERLAAGGETSAKHAELGVLGARRCRSGWRTATSAQSRTHSSPRLLGAGNGARITPQKRQRLGDRLRIVSWSPLLSATVAPLSVTTRLSGNLDYAFRVPSDNPRRPNSTARTGPGERGLRRKLSVCGVTKLQGT